MQILHITKLVALLTIGATALPTSGGSGVYTRDVDQPQEGVVGRSIVNNLDSVADSGRLEARAESSSEEKKRLKKEAHDKLEQEARARSNYQCPHCPAYFSNAKPLNIHLSLGHLGLPAYNAKTGRPVE
ncbi:uncharacterized protein PgNI_08355 [Pyricularia grisea]|uniref:C2H2-type domain-containing protein n=1 Tax=Pyricularia grisea TaxID=148305 RepID=A0A6P8AU23_PYRGI|nr:uncharacterized protein PgNI_08355 [Pyricularia grisea]TLD05716.1 hypothetical protein PgNI_08355 [Pyricularia grisea]